MERITSSLVSASIKELPDTTSQERSLRDAAQNLEARGCDVASMREVLGQSKQFVPVHASIGARDGSRPSRVEGSKK